MRTFGGDFLAVIATRIYQEFVEVKQLRYFNGGVLSWEQF